MSRRHPALVNENRGNSGEVLARVFGNESAGGASYQDRLLARLSACRQQLGIVVEELATERLEVALAEFLLKIVALPARTPAQLMPTLRTIVRDPVRFLRESESYDPEVVARVMRKCSKKNDNNLAALTDWELGRGPGPPPAEISEAASAVLSDIREFKKANSRKKPQTEDNQTPSHSSGSQVAGLSVHGRSKQQHVEDLAIDLGRIFLAAGGTVRRNVRRGEAGESGSFHCFLDIVLEPVRPEARKLGVVLTTSTMVRQVMKAGKPK